MYTVHCTVYIVHCTMCTVHYTVYIYKKFHSVKFETIRLPIGYLYTLAYIPATYTPNHLFIGLVIMILILY